MAQPDPGYHANEGTPEQLPRGEAQALNENTNVEAPLETEAQPVADAPGTEETQPAIAPEDEALLNTATAQDFNPLYEPATEDEQFILGPSTRPDEAQTAGTEPRSPVSARTRLLLPVLQKAAEEPGASEELKRLVEYLLRTA